MSAAGGEPTGRGGEAWVFHEGALGDSVIIWPLLRGLARGMSGAGGGRVRLFTAASLGALAERYVGVEAVPSHAPGLSGLWAGESLRLEGRGEGWGRPTRVVTFVADPATEAGARWHAAVRASSPGVEVEYVGVPGTGSREAFARGVMASGSLKDGIALRFEPRGPVVCHVGAGSASKRWPMERWAELAGRVEGEDGAGGGVRVRFVAGPVECERFSAGEREAFRAMGGAYVEGLEALCGVIESARAFVAADTGPAHLAAQLGVPTVVLFGPTDPAVWTPVGPAVRVVRAKCGAMGGIGVEEVAGALGKLLVETDGAC